MRLVSVAIGETCALRSLRAAARALDSDQKNIHAWTHRGFIARAFPETCSEEEEVRFTETMLDRDVRNNSAWNARFVAAFPSFESSGPPSSNAGTSRFESFRGKLGAEMDFCEKRLARAPDNESAWNYYRGLVRNIAKNDGAFMGRAETFARRYCEPNPRTEEPVRTADGWRSGSGETPDPRRRAALSFLGELLSDSSETRKKEDAVGVFARLVSIDPIRANYWAHRLEAASRLVF
jgi:protein farnesyltransferase/geranylgeranyltransferase type-1 subunit alpha